MEPASRDSDFLTREVLGGLLALLLALVRVPACAASVKPGDLISPENVQTVADLVSPGNFALVKQGMRIKIVRAIASNGQRPTRPRPKNIPRR
jgi:hypothetical protein